MDYNDQNQQKAKVLVSAEEQAQIVRTLRAWLNSSPPVQALSLVLDYEYLPETRGLTMTTSQGAYKTAQFILGGYRAQYSFRIVYRAIAEDTDERIAMDEALNAIGAWAETNDPPDFGEAIRVRSIRRADTSGIFARYDDGVEDHQISIIFDYEVI